MTVWLYKIELNNDQGMKNERMFNMRAGFDGENDTLPEMFFGKDAIDKKEFEGVLSDYYHFRDWHQNGKPSKRKLEELGLLKEN